jgi:hypothetical protein
MGMMIAAVMAPRMIAARRTGLIMLRKKLLTAITAVLKITNSASIAALGIFSPLA